MSEDPFQTADAAFTDLLARARAGDAGALDRVLAQTGAQVRRELEINALWQSVIDADDVMQITYIDAFLNFNRFVGCDARALLAWLRHIAQNNLIDAIRALEREKRPHPAKRIERIDASAACSRLCELMGVTTTTPSRVAAVSEAKLAVETALRGLPERYGQVLRLFELEGRTGPEVAAALGCSRVAAFMLRARARDALRDALNPASRFFSA